MNGVNRNVDAIGVFDSGVGGLSVLRALLTELPHERFVYLADQGHAPYGEREDRHIIERASAITRYLTAQHRVKAMVVACNTATAAAIHLMRETHPELPIVGIEPALKPAVALSTTHRIGVMATRGTLQSEKFRTLLESLSGQAEFVLQPCDGLADAIERSDAIQIGAICAQSTSVMGTFGSKPGQIDTLVLGCTHYPFVRDVLKSLVGQPVHMLEGGAPVARQTRRVLEQRGWLAGSPIAHAARPPQLVIGSTGTTDGLQNAVQCWLGLDCSVASWKL